MAGVAPPPRLRVKPTRGLSFALFFTGLIWMLAARMAAVKSARGFATQFNLVSCEALLREGFWLLLMMLGFTLLRWISTRAGDVRATNAMPARATALREFGTGVAMGWVWLVAAIVPMVLLRMLHPVFEWSGFAWLGAIVSAATLLLGTLALEVAFRGYLYVRLRDAIGNTAATVLMSLVYAVFLNVNLDPAGLRSFLITFVFGLVLALCWQRTHAVWLGWGLHFGFGVMAVVLFGMPLAGNGTYAGVVTMYPSGLDAVTGGDFGPDASVITLALAMLVVPLVYAWTRDYAWEYTHEPIIAGGYEMEAQPPAAHVAMQNAAIPPAPKPLVQILGATPTSASTVREIDAHLRGEAPGATDGEPEI